jgi:hypothetical protein
MLLIVVGAFVVAGLIGYVAAKIALHHIDKRPR